MSVHCNEYNSVFVITVDGDLCAPEALSIRAALKERVTQANIVFNLAQCRFLASAGLDALLQALRDCKRRGGKLVLAGLDHNCRKILAVTRLDRHFECHEQLASALSRVA